MMGMTVHRKGISGSTGGTGFREAWNGFGAGDAGGRDRRKENHPTTTDASKLPAYAVPKNVIRWATKAYIFLAAFVGLASMSICI